MVVTVANRGPATVGFVENVTVSNVVDAAVTVPIAPLLNATALFPGVVPSKPKPLMFTVAAFVASRNVGLGVTVGMTVAT